MRRQRKLLCHGCWRRLWWFERGVWVDEIGWAHRSCVNWAIYRRVTRQ